MRSSDDYLIKTFARCFRLLAKLNAGINDGFFVSLISKESENLLSEYLKFLKLRGDIIANSKVGPRNKARLWHGWQISAILKLLEIIKHTNQIDEITTPLLLERELLKLKLLLLDHDKTPQNTTAKPKTSGRAAVSKTQKPEKSTKPFKLGEAHKRIAEFVKSRERVQNIEVFAQFATTTRRTLKRKLSELVQAGDIKRLPLGKKVFYTCSS